MAPGSRGRNCFLLLYYYYYGGILLFIDTRSLGLPIDKMTITGQQDWDDSHENTRSQLVR
jgi:hypothetical protein